MYRRLLIFFAGCLLTHAAGAQSLDSSISRYARGYEQEKIHIHFDKDGYLPGETVWMKAYLLSGSKPSDISKNIYFDWTDAHGRLLAHSISPVADGAAVSSFVIPRAVPNGVVHVKAYTQWMLNFDNAFLYNRDIPVLTPSDEFAVTPEKIIPELHFYAEGGDLVNGVDGLLAFEVLDQHGRPVAVRGVIKNEKNMVLDSFSTRYNGMGSFSFRPSRGERYRAFWEDETGASHITPLPEAKFNGVVLHITSDQKDQVRYRLERSVDAVSLNRLTVIGTIDQTVVYRNNLNLVNRVAETSIGTASFPDGILQLTVFDEHLSPLAERVIFVNNGKSYGRTKMKPELVNRGKRARNEISIEIPDSITTSLSVSVTDGGMGSDSNTNIYSDLLLTGDLQGNIRDAASYLKNSPEATDHMNLLLLTHGWRRYNWDAVVSGRLPELKYPRDTHFLALGGAVLGSAIPLDATDSIALLMISRDQRKHVLNLPVNAAGKFNQDGLFFYDSIQVVYKFNHVSKLDHNSGISLYSDLLPALTPARASEPGYAWMKVPEVILEKELNGNIVETKEYSVPSDAMSYILTPKAGAVRGSTETAAHYLSTMFADLRFPASLKEHAAKTGDGKLTSYSAGQSSTASNVNISLDGAGVAMDDLKSIPMREVLFIKFVPKTSPKALPTLAISTRQALEQRSILENKTGFAVVTGYTPVKEFYAPRYANDKIIDYAASDFRSTLYWNPDLRLDKSHRKVRLVFYNNDISNKFRVIIEGMNEQGKLTRIEEVIK